MSLRLAEEVCAWEEVGTSAARMPTAPCLRGQGFQWGTIPGWLCLQQSPNKFPSNLQMERLSVYYSGQRRRDGGRYLGMLELKRKMSE